MLTIITLQWIITISISRHASYLKFLRRATASTQQHGSCSSKVRLPIIQFRNCDCEKRRVSPLLHRLCIPATSLNAQLLTLGTVKPRVSHSHQSVLCNVGRVTSSEKPTTETVQKIANIKRRESRVASPRVLCKRRGQSTVGQSSMISISNNGRDFDTCPLWDLSRCKYDTFLTLVRQRGP